MKKPCLIALVCGLIFSSACPALASKGGIKFNYTRIFVENLPIGNTISMKKIAKLPLRITNKFSEPMLVVFSLEKPVNDLIPGFEAIPDTGWVTTEYKSITVPALAEIESDVIIRLPDDAKLLGKKFQVNISATLMQIEKSGALQVAHPRFFTQLSIQENCWHSEGNGQSDFGFYLDGHYHSVIVLTRWPRTTYPGIIQRLTNLRLLDYTITVNVDPLPITQEINKEEKAHDRVAGDYASEKKISLLTVMEKKQKKIHALMQGQTIPFNALFVIRVWDKTKDGLNAKAGAIKNAINSMNSAQYFESNLPSTSKNLFFQTWPGWTWGRYEHRKLYSEHRYLADMLPVTSTFTGHLENRRGHLRRPATTIWSASRRFPARRIINRRSTPCCSA